METKNQPQKLMIPPMWGTAKVILGIMFALFFAFYFFSKKETSVDDFESFFAAVTVAVTVSLPLVLWMFSQFMKNFEEKLNCLLWTTYLSIFLGVVSLLDYVIELGGDLLIISLLAIIVLLVTSILAGKELLKIKNAPVKGIPTVGIFLIAYPIVEVLITLLIEVEFFSEILSVGFVATMVAAIYQVIEEAEKYNEKVDLNEE
ncbi:MAG: hypothetical protein ACRCZY_01390 [Phocaeicola sp.]